MKNSWFNSSLSLRQLGPSTDCPFLGFSQNSRCKDQTIKLWSLDGKELNTLQGHRDAVISVSFSPDGKTIASASEDQTIKLWDFDPSRLRALGCSQIRGYLETNPNVAEGDRHLCDGVGTSR